VTGRATISPRLQRTALFVGLAGIVALAAGAVMDLGVFMRAYFAALMVFWQLPLGCLAILIAYHLMGGRWGMVIGDALEAGVRTLPLMALLFLPVLLDLNALYPWTHPAFLAEHPAVADKAAWLNEPFFIARSLLYLAVWIGLALALTVPRQPIAERPLRQPAAAAGAILYPLTASFAGIDWMMSLEPAFNSTIYGLVVMSGQAVAAFALAVFVTLAISEVAGRLSHLREEGLVGLGTLLYALVLLWVYHVFMQLLVIWSGNLPHGAEWDLVRIESPWRALAWAIGIGHFALPFLIFLSSRARRSWQVVMGVAVVLLLMRLLDQLWLVLPAFGEQTPPAWLVAGALAAIGGVWCAAFLRLVARRAPWVAATVGEVGRG
jgi:hypothetical protein